MKVLLTAAILFFGTFFTSAQETSKPEGESEPVLRKPFTLHLPVDKEHFYEQEVGAIPYVHAGVVYLFKDDVVGVELTERENGFPLVNYCEDLEKADVVFRFSQKFDKKEGILAMLLAIESRLEKELYMDGMMVVPEKERVFETNLLPLKPKLTNYESWPHPIVQLAIMNLRFVEAKPANLDIGIPQDRVVTLKDTRVEELIRSYSILARKELPEVIERFNEGLEPGEKLFFTTRIDDPAVEGFEQVFIRVTEIEEDTVSGKIASNLTRITNYRAGDLYSCSLSRILDWTIQKPDKSEEGNYIGRFIDIVKDDLVPLLIKVELDAKGKATNARFDQALNRYKQDVSYCIPETAKREAEKMILGQAYEATGKEETVFVYLFYRFHDDVVVPPDPEKPEEAPPE